MDLEHLKEKYRAEGYADGVLAERLRLIRGLERVAAATDIEAAIHAEHERLVTLQAHEASARAAGTKSLPGAQETARSGALDNGDLVASAMGLSHGSAKPSPRVVGAKREPDLGDRVAAAMAAEKRVGKASHNYETVYAEELAKLLAD